MKKLLQLAALAACVVVAAVLIAPAPAEANPKTTAKEDYENIGYVLLPSNPAPSATTALVDAGSLDGAVGSTLTVADAGVALPGRNLIATFVDGDAADGGPSDVNLSASIRVDGYDQFRVRVSETFTRTAAGSLTVTGTKIFSTITAVTVTAHTGQTSGDTVSLGWGSKVGIPIQFSKDLHEIKLAEKIAANQTTRTAIAVNTTNFDITNFAVNAAAFGGTVTAGDSVKLLVELDEHSPDNRFSPGR